MTGDFTDKPATRSFFEALDAFARSLGPCTRDVKAQVSYAVRRKFLWMWAYEKTPDGTLYLTVCLDDEVEDARFHYLTLIFPGSECELLDELVGDGFGDREGDAGLGGFEAGGGKIR
jgi:hypothetical protein